MKYLPFLNASNSCGLFGAMLCLVALLTMPGCGGGDSDTPADGAPATDAAAPSESSMGATTESATATGLHGRVTFEGPAPQRVELDIESDLVCLESHTEALLSETEVVSADGGVQWAFVYVKNPPEDEVPVPEDHVILDQIGCKYVPHVMGMRAGQILDVKSSDNTTHNVRSFPSRSGGNRAFNISITGPGVRERKKSFSKAEPHVKVKCDIHPWMTGYVFSMAHPFFAVTDENGHFSIDGLPAGEYTLVSWHETYGEQETTVTVDEGAASEATFTYTP